MSFSTENFLYILIPVIVGAVIGSVFTMYGMKGFRLKKMPPGMPPGWLFGMAWLILYAISVVSFYFIYNQLQQEGNPQSKLYLGAAYASIVLNFMWCIVFFGSKGAEIASRVGIILILALIGILVYLIYAGWAVNIWPSALLFAYIAWLVVALYLNCAFVIVNSRPSASRRGDVIVELSPVIQSTEEEKVITTTTTTEEVISREEINDSMVKANQGLKRLSKST